MDRDQLIWEAPPGQLVTTFPEATKPWPEFEQLSRGENPYILLLLQYTHVEWSFLVFFLL